MLASAYFSSSISNDASTALMCCEEKLCRCHPDFFPCLINSAQILENGDDICSDLQVIILPLCICQMGCDSSKFPDLAFVTGD